jgi:hypothetical protein
MLQIEDALTDFKKAYKSIMSDKKAVSSDKLKAKVAGDLNELIDQLEKLASTKKELQKLISEAGKIKDRVKKYNDDQHAMMKDAKDIGTSCGKVSADTKAKDFAAVAKDANSLQALNDLESL